MKKGELRKKKTGGKTPCNIDGEFLITDTCFWEEDAEDDYNPLDPTRSPHEIECVDIKTGTVVRIPSGTVIKIVRLSEYGK